MMNRYIILPIEKCVRIRIGEKGNEAIGWIMKFDFKNILIGIIIGVLSTIIVGCLVNDVYIDIRIGDDLNKEVLDDVLID